MVTSFVVEPGTKTWSRLTAETVFLAEIVEIHSPERLCEFGALHHLPDAFVRRGLGSGGCTDGSNRKREDAIRRNMGGGGRR